MYKLKVLLAVSSSLFLCYVTPLFSSNINPRANHFAILSSALYTENCVCVQRIKCNSTKNQVISNHFELLLLVKMFKYRTVYSLINTINKCKSEYERELWFMHCCMNLSHTL